MNWLRFCLGYFLNLNRCFVDCKSVRISSTCSSNSFKMVAKYSFPNVSSSNESRLNCSNYRHSFILQLSLLKPKLRLKQKSDNQIYFCHFSSLLFHWDSMTNFKSTKLSSWVSAEARILFAHFHEPLCMHWICWRQWQKVFIAQFIHRFLN